MIATIIQFYFKYFIKQGYILKWFDLLNIKYYKVNNIYILFKDIVYLIYFNF